jgi:uncharacterized damage-inducible protein DinB
MDVVDLVRYNDTVRSLYLDALEQLAWAEVVKSRGASFDSMRNVFLHLTLVEDRWVSYTLVGRFAEWKDPDFDAYTDFSKLREYTTQVHENTKRYLNRLKPQDYNRTVANPWMNNSPIRIETALTHMVMEDMVHFGELSALFWQIDVEPPYLAFLRFQNRDKAL